MQRPSIQAAVERKQQSERPAVRSESAPADPRSAKASPLPAVSREGKVNVSAYFPSEVKASLRLVQAKRGGKVQDLLAEALNLLFAKYNVPESAPVGKQAE
jgi:hypothetical protein